MGGGAKPRTGRKPGFRGRPGAPGQGAVLAAAAVVRHNDIRYLQLRMVAGCRWR